MKANIYGVDVEISDAEINRYVYEGCTKQNWKPELYAVLDRFLKPGMTVIDCGAYVGSIALYAAAKGCRVYAVECDPVTLPVLRENVALNPGLAGKITVCPVAVADKSGTLTFGARGQFGTSTAGLNFDEAETVDIQALTLADLMTQYDIKGVEFLKVNVQGSEGPMLWRASSILDEFMPTVHVYIRPESWQRVMVWAHQLELALCDYPHIYTEDGKPFELAWITDPEWLAKHDYKLIATNEGWK